ncbi:MAG: NADH-quinone oxidoreductase subunit C, partial [Deltaproteobacteria bacterium]
MDWKTVLEKLRSETEIIETRENARDEVYITVASSGFARACCALHKLLNAPVAMMWATDERSVNNSFGIWCGFRAPAFKRWVFARTSVSAADPRFEGFSRTVYSASLFEREIKEMFGIEPAGSPDLRRLRLHSEVWPEGFYPLRKDFKMPPKTGGGPDFQFARGEGEGIFEVPVGPVHAGI